MLNSKLRVAPDHTIMQKAILALYIASQMCMVSILAQMTVSRPKVSPLSMVNGFIYLWWEAIP